MTLSKRKWKEIFKKMHEIELKEMRENNKAK